MNELSVVQKIIVYILPVLFAITLHEVAHGWVAKLFGDPTAEKLGRLSLNPIRHIDPVGTILVPLLLVATTSLLGGSPFLFGWAKPVPVDYRNLRNPKKDMIWVAAAGPAANLVMAILWGILLNFAQSSQWAEVAQPLMWMGYAGIGINVSLFALNLLPLPPLDGGRILVGLLPHNLAWKVAQIEPYGFMILLALMATNILSLLLQPFYLLALNIVLAITSIF